MRSGLGARQLGGIGIALLRHDRGAGGEAVGEARRSRNAASPRARSPRRSAKDARRVIEAAASASSAKSRSETASSEFAVGRSKPSALAVALRSIGNAVPASAAAPSGNSFSRRRQSAKRPRSRAKHLDIGEEVMAEGDRLRALQMREARHHRGGIGLRLVGQRRLQRVELARRSRRSRRAPRASGRSPPGRCASGRCAGGRPPRRSISFSRASTCVWMSSSARENVKSACDDLSLNRV